MATFEDFSLRYPELIGCGNENQAAIERYLDEYVDLYGYPGSCPKYADLLQMAYAAHLTSRSGHNPDGGPDDAPGPVQSESVGGVSYSYAVKSDPSKLSGYFGSTPYGQDFLRLLNMCQGTGVMTAP